MTPDNLPELGDDLAREINGYLTITHMCLTNKARAIRYAANLIAADRQWRHLEAEYKARERARSREAAARAVIAMTNAHPS